MSKESELEPKVEERMANAHVFLVRQRPIVLVNTRSDDSTTRAFLDQNCHELYLLCNSFLNNGRSYNTITINH